MCITNQGSYTRTTTPGQIHPSPTIILNLFPWDMTIRTFTVKIISADSGGGTTVRGPPPPPPSMLAAKTKEREKERKGKKKSLTLSLTMSLMRYEANKIHTEGQGEDRF